MILDVRERSQNWSQDSSCREPRGTECIVNRFVSFAPAQADLGLI